MKYKRPLLRRSNKQAVSPAKSPRQPTQLRPLAPLFKKLDDHQQDAVEFTLDVKTSALIFEQGTGKTWIAGGVVEQLFSPDFSGMMVVPLSNLESTWLKFLQGQLGRVPLYRDWVEFKEAPTPKLFLVHYEALKKPRLIERIRRLDFTFIGYDESQRLKNRSSLESRIAAKLRDSAEYKLILSGTPMDEYPSDLWAQFRFVHPEVFGTRWKDFEEEYLEPIDETLEQRFKESRPGSFKWKQAMRLMRIAQHKRPFNFDKLDQFTQAIKPYTMRVTKDVLGLKPMRERMCPVVLRGEQRALYRSLARDMIASSGSSTITAQLRITQIGKLQQVCGGFVADDDGYWLDVGRAKIRKVRQLVRQRDKPIVVFCRYLEEVFAIGEEMEDMGLRYRILVGEVKPKDRAPIIDDFQAGKVDVIICQLKTGGVGIDLFRAHTAIFYSYSHSHIDFDQAKSRLHRRGQEYAVDIFLIYARDTIDEDILGDLRRKRKITSKALVQLERKRNTSWLPRKPHRRATSAALSISMASLRSPRSSTLTRRPCAASCATPTLPRTAAATAGTARRR